MLASHLALSRWRRLALGAAAGTASQAMGARGSLPRDHRPLARAGAAARRDIGVGAIDAQDASAVLRTAFDVERYIAALRQDVTCTIIACNEADRIGRCIRSVQGLVREVIVVDCGSTDGTAAVAAALGARVVHNDWPGFGPQKRFAEAAATHDWILNLDADEWLPDAVREELAALFARPIPDTIHGFRFDIVTVYPGAERPRPLADAHHYVRLYDRRRCRFPESLVYDEVKLPDTRAGAIQAPVYHQSIRSIGHLVEKNLAYFQLQRREVRMSRLAAAGRLLFEPLLAFLKYYLLRRHCTGGFYGLKIALAEAYLRTRRLVSIGLAGGRPS